jgi:hypothetical protein
MKMPKKEKIAAFTLTEVMISAACGVLILAALLLASVALQRSFLAVEGYSTATGDQLRVQDYIAMDCRRAIKVLVNTGSWTNSGGTYRWVYDATKSQTLLLSVPSYYDGTSQNPVAPYFDGNGKIQYDASLSWQQTLPDGTTVTNSGVPISYYKSGTYFIRQIGADPTNTTKTKAIATNVATFNVTPMGSATVDGTVSCSITFSPSFTRLPGPGPIAGTTIYSQTFLRNAQARQ